LRGSTETDMREQENPGGSLAYLTVRIDSRRHV
jgi:hypothetical protein